jgi:hypothetical protein
VKKWETFLVASCAGVILWLVGSYVGVYRDEKRSHEDHVVKQRKQDEIEDRAYKASTKRREELQGLWAREEKEDAALLARCRETLKVAIKVPDGRRVACLSPADCDARQGLVKKDELGRYVCAEPNGHVTLIPMMRVAQEGGAQ